MVLGEFDDGVPDYRRPTIICEMLRNEEFPYNDCEVNKVYRAILVAPAHESWAAAQTLAPKFKTLGLCHKPKENVDIPVPSACLFTGHNVKTAGD